MQGMYQLVPICNWMNPSLWYFMEICLNYHTQKKTKKLMSLGIPRLTTNSTEQAQVYYLRRQVSYL